MINHSFFSAPFRPFFLFGSLIGILFPMYWVGILVNDYAFPDSFIAPIDWHAFEMIFGFTTAILTGFILTASAHWTNKPMMSKGPLVLLFFFWVLERTLFLIPNIPAALLLFAHLPFFSLLLAHLYKKFMDDPPKLFSFGLIFTFLFIFKYLFLLGIYYDMPNFVSYSKEISLNLITMIIVLVTGKIFPFFTSKACPEITITKRPYIEMAAKLIVLFIIFTPLLPQPGLVQAILFLLAGALHILRWLNWHPLKTRKVILLFSLHIGYLWMIVYFLLKGLGHFISPLNFSAAALHSFTMGTLGVLILSIMTRVALGHSGRPLKVNQSFYWALILVNLGALIRVLMPIALADYYLESLHYAMGSWTLGYIVYLVGTAPILWKPSLA